ncbi:hypothetical protein ACVJBD_005163 [Rhizobium mongolense]
MRSSGRDIVVWFFCDRKRMRSGKRAIASGGPATKTEYRAGSVRSAAYRERPAMISSVFAKALRTALRAVCGRCNRMLLSMRS